MIIAVHDVTAFGNTEFGKYTKFGKIPIFVYIYLRYTCQCKIEYIKIIIHHESYENHIFREQQGFCTNEPMAWVAGSNPLEIRRLYDITAKRGTSGEIILRETK